MRCTRQQTNGALSAPGCSQVGEYVAAMEKIKLREGIKIVMALSADGNKFIQVCAVVLLLGTLLMALCTMHEHRVDAADVWKS